MAINKTIIIGSVTAGVVVVTAAVSGAIFAANTSPNDSVITSKIEQNIKLNGWQQKSNDWYYYKDDIAKTGWIQDNNVWYYLDDSGKMKLNWIQYKDKWYYLGSDGKMRTGWIQDQGNWYYINSYGTIATNITIDGCYLNESGIMTDTPAQKSKQIENSSNSNATNSGNTITITANEALDLIYKNANADSEIASLEYHELSSKDMMKNLFKHYRGIDINEEAYVIARHDKHQEGDPVFYYVGKESKKVYWIPDSTLIQEIKNNKIVNSYTWIG